MMKNTPISRVGILCKPHRSEAIRSILSDLLPWLRSRGVTPLLDPEGALLLRHEISCSRETIKDESEVVLVLGGDGTLLSAARLLAGTQIPILGVNLGNLGFLTEVQSTELLEVLSRTLQGDYSIENRIMLQVRIFRNRIEQSQTHVLNDIVINNGSIARLIESDIYMNAQFVTSLKGDGVIFSSPTGSTAYSLSAGGPILYPGMDGIIITPICPHTLTHRPIVIPGAATLEILIKKGDESVTATLDGQVGHSLKVGDMIEITRSPHITKLIVNSERNYFEVLRDKLKWGDT
ncbi:MAG: NAD(+)/NADH kinase [Nitrospiraceae bacterium]|nr:NAD(+)/NADH kinase [Nitrospiraceae bacterium]